MSLRDEFQVYLPSNVTGLDTNKPGAYETTLAYPLELPGNWEVALIDITYPHTWLDLEQECVIGISTVYNRNDEDNVDIVGESNSMKLVKAMKDVESYQQGTNEYMQYRNPAGRWRVQNRQVTIDFKVKKTFGIIPKKYKLIEILDKLQSEIREIGSGLDQTRVTYDKESDRVVISDHQKKLLISSYSNNSILPMLGFANNIRTNKDEYLLKHTMTSSTGEPLIFAEHQAHVDDPKYTLIDYIFIDANTRFESGLPPKLGRLNEIYVYTDIIDTVLVGNTQAPMLGYYPIQSKWGDQS